MTHLSPSPEEVPTTLSPAVYTSRLNIIESYPPLLKEDGVPFANDKYTTALALHRQNYGETVYIPMSAKELIDMELEFSGLPTDDDVRIYIDNLPFNGFSDIDMEAAKLSLFADEEALKTFKLMMLTGHEPDFFMVSERGGNTYYTFGTASTEVPAETYSLNRGSLFDTKLANRIRERLSEAGDKSIALLFHAQSDLDVSSQYGATAFEFSDLVAMAKHRENSPIAPETIWIGPIPNLEGASEAVMLNLQDLETASIDQSGAAVRGQRVYPTQKRVLGLRICRDVKVIPKPVDLSAAVVGGTIEGFHEKLAGALSHRAE